MSKIVLSFGALVAVIGFLGVAGVRYQIEEAALKTKIAAQESELATRAAELQKARKEVEALAQQKTWLTQEAQTLRKKIETLRPEPAPQAVTPENQAAATPEPAKKAGGLKGMLAEMMKDPAMKDAIRTQQKMVMERQMAGLIKELGLTPGQGQELIELLVNKQMEVMDAMQGGKADLKGLETDYNAQIKTLLGSDARYAKYQDYQKTIPSRLVMDQLKQQLANTQSPLQDFQAEPMLKIIQEESSRPSPGLKAMQDLKPDDYSNPELLDKLMAHQEDLNQRILTRATSFLNKAQLQALETFQRSQVELQRAGLVMAGKMMKPESSSSGATPAGK